MNSALSQTQNRRKSKHKSDTKKSKKGKHRQQSPVELSYQASDEGSDASIEQLRGLQESSVFAGNWDRKNAANTENHE